MQSAVLNLALEQLEAANTQASILSGLAERLSTEGFTMDLALEADRLHPGLNAADLYFSAAADKRQVALEGVLESLWTTIVNLFNALVKWIKGLFAKKDDLKSEGKAAEEAVAQADQQAEKTEQEAKEVKITDLNHYVAENHGASPKLSQLLQKAPWEAHEYVNSVAGGHSYGTIMEEFLANTKNIASYLQDDLTKHATSLKSLVQDALKGQPVDVTPLMDALKDELPIQIHGHGQMPVKAARSMLEHYARDGHGRNGTPIDFGKLRAAMKGKRQHSLDKFSQDTQLLLNGLNRVEDVLVTMNLPLDRMSGALSHHKPSPEESAAAEKLWKAVNTIAVRLRDIGRVLEVYKSYVTMVKEAANYYKSVMVEVAALVQKVEKNSEQADAVRKEADERAAAVTK